MKKNSVPLKQDVRPADNNDGGRMPNTSQSFDLKAMKAEKIDQAWLDQQQAKKSTPENAKAKLRDEALAGGFIEIFDQEGFGYLVHPQSPEGLRGDASKLFERRKRKEARLKSIRDRHKNELSDSPGRALTLEEASAVRDLFTEGLETLQKHRWFK